MPQFYFDINQGDGQSFDTEGLELADLEAVRNEAIGVLRDLALDILPDRDRWECVVNVRDKMGRIVFSATLSLLTEGWMASLVRDQAETVADRDCLFRAARRER